MQVATGHARRCPDSASFRRALEAELARMEAVPYDADHGVSGAWGRFSAAAMSELGHGAAAVPDPGGLVGRRVMV